MDYISPARISGWFGIAHMALMTLVNTLWHSAAMHPASISLNQQLLTFWEAFRQRLSPEERRKLCDAADELQASKISATALHAGDRAPDFVLPDQHGRLVRLSDRLERGPVVVLFIRGGWCPFCTLTLRAYQAALPDIQHFGADLLAITPQPADRCAVMAERDLLAFPTLSDHGNKVSEAFGVVYELAPVHRALYHRLGHDLPKMNGTGDWRIPLPATFIIGQDGIIARAHVEPIVHARLEPSTVVTTLQGMLADA